MNLREFLRFGVVGFAQNGLNVAVFAAGIAAGVGYVAAAAAAFAVALLASFTLNRSWTFDDAGVAAGHQFRRYTLVFIAASGAGVAILAMLVEWADWRPVASQVVAILVVAPLSYLAQRTFAFKVPMRLR